MKRWHIYTAGGLLAVSILGWLLSGAEPTSENKPPSPALAVASSLGRVEPVSRVRKVAPPDFLSNPRVEALLVQEGSVVQEGELLGWFAGRARAMASVQLAQAALERARAESDRVKAGAKPGELQAAAARERRATTQKDLAARDAARAEKLRTQNILSIGDTEEKLAALEVAQAELRAAQEERAALQEVRSVDVLVAEKIVAEATAELARAQIDVTVQEIRAPISGTVLRIGVWPGEATDTRGVLELADLSRMQVVAEIYETDASSLMVGQTAEVIVPGLSKRLPAKVSEGGWMVKKKDILGTDPVADIDSRVVEVRMLLDEEGTRLLQRMTNQQVQVIVFPTRPIAR